jgi:ribosomal protein S18 acetylase RimI-like enzyme
MTGAPTAAVARSSAAAPSERMAAVRRATRADVDAVADVLARSFDDDPVFLHLFRTDRRRAGALRRLFRRATLEALPHGEVHVTAAGDAAAVCYPPSAPRDTLLGTLRLVPALASAGGWRRLPDVLRTLSFIDEHHPAGQHYYLLFMGVLPERQGRGVGRALLEDLLRGPAAAGMPAYLEATSPDNARLYERLGFRTVRELPLPGGGPVMRAMWRDASYR